MWHRCTTEFRWAILRAYEQSCIDRVPNTLIAPLSTADLLRAAWREPVAEETLKAVGLQRADFDRWQGDLGELGTATDYLTLSDAAIAARDAAYNEAVYFGDSQVGVEHLLIGLAHATNGAAGRFFAERGVTVERLRQALFDVQPQRTFLPSGITLDLGRERERQVMARRQTWKTRKTVLLRSVGALTRIGSDPLILSHLMRKQRVTHPHWFFTRLRKHGLYKSQVGGFWVAGRYEDVQTALRTPALSARRYDTSTRDARVANPFVQRYFNSLHTVMNRLMLFQDAPEQTRLRALVSRQFTPRFIVGMQAEIQSVADALIDKVVAQGSMDLIADFAFPFPATVIARLLGVSETDLLQFKAWSDDFVRFITFATNFADEVRIHHALEGIGAYFTDAIARERASAPSQTLLSLLTHATGEDGERLTDDEITANALLLLAAGHETTTHLIGNGLRLLLTHPDARRAVQSDPSLLPGAIEEILRFEPPVQWTTRVVKETVTLGQQTLREGDSINLCLAAANRDPARFPAPDVFDIRRADNKHLGFGSGPHFCLGAALARMEAEIAFSTLLRRLPGLRLQSKSADWRFDFAFRAQKTLRVVWNRDKQAIE